MRTPLVSTPAHQLIEIDVASASVHTRDCHLNHGLLRTGEPVLVRLRELVGIGREFAETSPLVASVPRDTRDSATVAHSSSRVVTPIRPAPGDLLVGRIGRRTAAVDRVFVKDLFGHGVRWS